MCTNKGATGFAQVMDPGGILKLVLMGIPRPVCTLPVYQTPVGHPKLIFQFDV
jgi:hypothetical protein